MFLYYYETAVFIKSRRYRRQYYENIADTADAVAACRFSFEQVTRREITSSIISGCDWQRSPAVRPRAMGKLAR